MFILFVPSAHAGPKEVSLELYQKVQASSLVFVDAIDQVEEKSKDTVLLFQELVKNPLITARTTWLKAMHGSADKKDYLAYFPCESAAVSLEGLSDKWVAHIKQETTAIGGKLELRYFKEDLAVCEKALGLPITFEDHLPADED